MQIVICDKHELFAQAFSALLEARGHEVVACQTTLGDAVSFVPSGTDVVVTELNFPDAHGVSALSELRQVLPETPIAVLTGSNDYAEMNAALAAGADGVVMKTESVDEVERILLAITSPNFAKLRGSSTPEKALSRRVRALSKGNHRARDDLRPTSREVQVIELLARGATTEEIAERLDVRAATVRTHLRHVFVKMGVHSRVQLIAVAVREGLLNQVGSGSRRVLR
jgi:DNA-binding NarL/FixJ family response regulator